MKLNTREIYLDRLPRRGKFINWKESVGSHVKFNYEGVEGYVKITDYDGKDLSIKYLDKSLFTISTGNFKKCKIGVLLGKITIEFKIEIGKKIKDDKRDIIITNREYRVKNYRGVDQNKKWYKYTCNICGWTEGWLEERHLLEGLGCSCCRGLTSVETINDIPTTASWMTPYFKGGYDEAKTYTKSSGKKIYPICPDCGRVKDKLMKICDIYTNHSIGCSCTDGVKYPEKIMSSVLEQLKIDFKTQYSPNWCRYILRNTEKRGYYDFYFQLNYKDCIIETDGGFHKNDNVMNGQKKEESQYIDDYKDRLAKENGMEVIRIDCYKSNLEYIKQNIINSRLNELFDLSQIDWRRVEEFALSNRIKEVCSLWKSGIRSTKEIAEIMKVNRGTIVSYLNKGTKLNWCNYNGKEEMRKSANSKHETNKKQVEIFKDELLLGIFDSYSELESKSTELFGIKLKSQGISKVCAGRCNNYKGFTFRRFEKIAGDN